MPSTIDVIIPVWNRAHSVRQAIDSVLAQKLPPDSALRVIVADDGSTDDLAGALQRYDARVSRVRHDRNRGAAAARNTGIAAADGDLLAFLDSDDVWEPDKLVRQIAFMRKHGYAASCTACHLVRAGQPGVVWPHYETGSLSRADLIWGCFVSPGTTMICEPRVFSEIGVFDTDFQRFEDWDWLLRFAVRYRLGYLAEPLARREPSWFADAQQTLDALEKIDEKHYSALPGIARRHFRAALACEKSAAHYRQENWPAALGALLRSFLMAPLAHAWLRALVASRFQWH